MWGAVLAQRGLRVCVLVHMCAFALLPTNPMLLTRHSLSTMTATSYTGIH